MSSFQLNECLEMFDIQDIGISRSFVTVSKSY